jgi:3-oxoacyl-(acyl-carrier-protein) synthase
MAEKVLVIGLGVVSPLGRSVEENWKNLVGAGLRARPQSKSHSTQLNFNPGSSNPNFGQTRRSAPTGFERACEFSRWAAAEALTDAGLWDGNGLQDIDPERISCTVSASKPLFDENRPLPPDVINDYVADQFGLEGERRNVIAACATGAYSIALGASWIEQGICDVVLAGSVEPYPHPLIAAGFRQMGVISSDGVTRPFDQRRSGFTFGEGAGVVVLESARHASRRHVRPSARLSGWALGSDSHSAVAFNSNGARIAEVIDRALDRAGLAKEMVRHVNAHGTATRLNDWIETQALQKAFGPHAEHLMISATKASTGHLLGASGSVELIFTVLALCHQFVPPTATLKKPDPKCPLDYTPRTGHAAAFEHALSLSFGFGGPIGVLVVSGS